MKWSHFQRDILDICLHILLTASDLSGGKNFHEKGKLCNEKDPNDPEETTENLPDHSC